MGFPVMSESSKTFYNLAEAPSRTAGETADAQLSP